MLVVVALGLRSAARGARVRSANQVEAAKIDVRVSYQRTGDADADLREVLATLATIKLIGFLAQSLLATAASWRILPAQVGTDSATDQRGVLWNNKGASLLKRYRF